MTVNVSKSFGPIYRKVWKTIIDSFKKEYKNFLRDIAEKKKRKKGFYLLQLHRGRM